MKDPRAVNHAWKHKINGGFRKGKALSITSSTALLFPLAPLTQAHRPDICVYGIKLCVKAYQWLWSLWHLPTLPFFLLYFRSLSSPDMCLVQFSLFNQFLEGMEGVALYVELTVILMVCTWTVMSCSFYGQLLEMQRKNSMSVCAHGTLHQVIYPTIIIDWLGRIVKTYR